MQANKQMSQKTDLNCQFGRWLGVVQWSPIIQCALEMCIFRSIAYRLQSKKPQRIPFIPEVDFLLFTVCGFANFVALILSFHFFSLFPCLFSGFFSLHRRFIIQCSSGYRHWITQWIKEKHLLWYYFCSKPKKNRKIINPILDKKRQEKRYK